MSSTACVLCAVHSETESRSLTLQIYLILNLNLNLKLLTELISSLFVGE